MEAYTGQATLNKKRLSGVVEFIQTCLIKDISAMDMEFTEVELVCYFLVFMLYWRWGGIQLPYILTHITSCPLMHGTYYTACDNVCVSVCVFWCGWACVWVWVCVCWCEIIWVSLWVCLRISSSVRLVWVCRNLCFLFIWICVCVCGCVSVWGVWICMSVCDIWMSVCVIYGPECVLGCIFVFPSVFMGHVCLSVGILRECVFLDSLFECLWVCGCVAVFPCLCPRVCVAMCLCEQLGSQLTVLKYVAKGTMKVTP